MKQQSIYENRLQSESDDKKEQSQIIYNYPFFRIVRLFYHPVLVIGHTDVIKITYCPSCKLPSPMSDKYNAGLDCSGQGECQPGIDNSDGDRMQQYLVKANRTKKVCTRRKQSTANRKKMSNKKL